MTVHERPVGATVEWYTPPEFFARLGMRFDMDPASPGHRVVPWVPARHHVTANGQHVAWYGSVWLNPPYGPALPEFVQRMCDHGRGVMLVPSRTETAWWQRAALSADAVVFLRDRLHFIRDDGFQARASFGSCLFVWGWKEVEAVVSANLGWWAPGDRLHERAA